jgi:hypothetical protein
LINKSNNSDFETLKRFTTALFPASLDTLAVQERDQQVEIESLRRTIGSERFFFVVDLVNFEMSESHGIQRWLGYNEKEFNLKKYWSIVHPGRQKSLMAVAIQLYQTLCTGKFLLEFMVQRYSSLVALKHYRGHYLLAKKTSSVFQYDAQNRLTAYIDEFTIIGDYNGEALNPVFFNKTGEKEIERGGAIMRQVVEQFLGMKIFSQKELQTARRLAYEPGITQAQLAAEFDVTVNTIDTYCRRFLQKSRDFFHNNFSSAAEAAGFLKKEGLL